jgi:magnesium-protoporphyrin O-methyltransferase
VVCCYPDAQQLLSAAARHTRRLLVYSHPADNLFTRAAIWSGNLAQRVRGNAFRAHLHPPGTLIAAAEREGLGVAYRHHAWDWDVVGLLR